MEKEIVIKPSFDAKSIFRALYYIRKNNKSRIIYITIIIILLITNIYNSCNSHPNIENSKSILDWLPFILIPFFIFIFIFKNYKKTQGQISENPRLKEDISYILNKECFQEKGESFEVKHFWENLFKIVEEKDMFLIFTQKNKSLFIKKSDLKENQYTELRELFNSLNIKKSLK